MVSISELAAQKVKEAQSAQDREGAYLRLYVAGMGCNGPNYGMKFDEIKSPEDVEDKAFGVAIVTNKRFVSYFEGATVVYVEGEGGGFEIRPARRQAGSCRSSST